MSTHSRLEEIARKAIQEVFADTSVSLKTTRLTLLDLKTDIEMRLDAVKIGTSTETAEGEHEPE